MVEGVYHTDLSVTFPKLLKMADSIEYLSLRNCSGSLETALKGDRDVVYYLNKEGFISDDMCDDLLNHSALTPAQKAGQLVAKIRDRVKLSNQEFHKLVGHLSQNSRQYGSIVDTLNTEYSRLGGTGKDLASW